MLVVCLSLRIEFIRVKTWTFLSCILIALTTSAPQSAHGASSPGESVIQQGLIISGGLSKAPGLAQKAELDAALAHYREVYSGNTEAANEEQAINALVASFMEELGFELDFDSEGRDILIPRKIMTTVKPYKTQTFYESSCREAYIYTYRWQIRRNPPSEMLRKTIERANQPEFEEFFQSSRDFSVRFKDQAPIRCAAGRHDRYQRLRAFVVGGHLVGLYFRYLDHPMKGFAPPKAIQPLVSYWTPPAYVYSAADKDARDTALKDWIKGRNLSKQQKIQLHSLIVDADQPPTEDDIDKLVLRWAWLHTMEATERLIADHFTNRNRWRTVRVTNCKAGRTQNNTGAQDIRIIIASNRRMKSDNLPKGPSDPADWFDANVDKTNRLHIGCAIVSVPQQTEAQYRMQVSKEVAKTDTASEYQASYSVSLDSVPSDETAYRLRLFDTERVKFRDETRALIYVHGYNTTFKHALFSAARIATATNYRGRVYLFSWPSAEEMLKYQADMDSAERSETHLVGFMRAILRDRALRYIDVLAHSMGSQMTLRALGDLRDAFYARDKISLGQVVFAAPDVATDIFKEKIREIGHLTNRVTVYSSSKDKALQLSTQQRGGAGTRLGQVVDGSKVGDLPNTVHIIDATTPSTICNGWGYVQLEHSYIGDNLTVLKHLTAVLAGRSSERAKLETVHKDKHVSIKHKKPECWWNVFD